MIEPNERIVLPVIACTLDGQSQADRVRQWRELASAGLRSADSEPGRLTIRYVLSVAQQARLRDLIESERHCCGFAQFAISAEADEITLVVSGPHGTERFFGFMHTED